MSCARHARVQLAGAGRRPPIGCAAVELGDIEPVQPRAVWASEARDFTPWLLSNAERLGRALGIELELHAAEHPVGGYSLDLIGQDLTNDAVLMVENQLEPTDHAHLGQVMTYAAGTGASTIVWIATAFRDEHRQALDWLNEQTGEDIHFFGVVLSLVRIGASAPAPLFEVVAKPNDWQKRVRSSTRTGSSTTRNEKYRAFWAEYLNRQATEHGAWGRRGTPQPANWMSFGGPFPGTQINPSFAQGRRLRHELYIDRGDSEANTALFEFLLQRREILETAYGLPLDFDPIDGKRACRIATYRNDGEIQEEDQWTAYLDWFLDEGERLRRALTTVAHDVRTFDATPATS